jgi:hypothetical protein
MGDGGSPGFKQGDLRYPASRLCLIRRRGPAPFHVFMFSAEGFLFK